MAIWNAPERTLLLVGEGSHEEAFLTHVKNLFVPRGCGLFVKIKNARGKGAQHVIDWTTKQLQNADYDACATLLDTDTDFTPKVIKTAKANGIKILKSEPCFEAMLLRLLGEKVNKNSKLLKKQLLPFVNGNPTISLHYAQFFTKKLLQKKRKNETAIDDLLCLFE